LPLKTSVRCALLFLFLLFMVSSCAHAPERKAGGGTYAAVASWYGPGFDGRRTASGEVFEQDGLTAAHRTYPFGTRLRVTNPQTGKSCVVVVNDRGPFVSGVDIDISRGASRAIGRLDTGPVRIEELGRDTRYVREVHTGKISGKGAYRVQVGSFLDPANAEHLKQGLEIGYTDVRVSQATVDGKTFNRVQAGRFRDKSDAYALARKLADEGYDTRVVRE
jgi:rare lipoprotein A